jgi:hypothetical protein
LVVLLGVEDLHFHATRAKRCALVDHSVSALSLTISAADATEVECLTKFGFSFHIDPRRSSGSSHHYTRVLACYAELAGSLMTAILFSIHLGASKDEMPKMPI